MSRVWSHWQWHVYNFVVTFFSNTSLSKHPFRVYTDFEHNSGQAVVLIKGANCLDHKANCVRGPTSSPIVWSKTILSSYSSLMCLAIKRGFFTVQLVKALVKFSYTSELCLYPIRGTWASDSTPPDCVHCNEECIPTNHIKSRNALGIQICNGIETELFRFQVRGSV